MEMLSKSYLLKALKKANDKSRSQGGPPIPHTYKSLLKYEKDGVIRQGILSVKGFGRGKDKSNWRVYTADEIESIVNDFVLYIQSR